MFNSCRHKKETTEEALLPQLISMKSRLVFRKFWIYVIQCITMPVFKILAHSVHKCFAFRFIRLHFLFKLSTHLESIFHTCHVFVFFNNKIITTAGGEIMRIFMVRKNFVILFNHVVIINSNKGITGTCCAFLRPFRF